MAVQLGFISLAWRRMGRGTTSRHVVVAAVGAIWLAAAVPHAQQPVTPAPRAAAASLATADVQAVLNKYCITCHNQRLKTAGLALETMNLGAVAEQAESWEKVVKKLRSGDR